MSNFPTYDKNRWEIHDPNKPNSEQPDAFIIKKKLDHIEEGIRIAHADLQIGTVTEGDTASAYIAYDEDKNVRNLNLQIPKGQSGKDAYETWLELGHTGSKQEFLDYLKGQDGNDGNDGADGDSAYQVWLKQGNIGSEQDFLDSLRGLKGEKGDSAYQVWINEGNSGTVQDFLNSLKGEDGKKGNTGDRGPSNYEVWITIPGNENKTKEEYFEEMKGSDGGNSSITFINFG